MKLRRATLEDIDALLAIDAASFPVEETDRQPAAPSEIEAGVKQNHVVVAEDQSGILGFIQVDVPGDDHVYIVAIDVRADAQRNRVGSTLLRYVLDMIPGDDVTVSSISGTHNLGMLRLLLGHGFVVTAVMRDYHGPGNDRFYFQYRTHNGFSDRENVYLIPVTNPGSVYQLLDSPEYIITSIVSSPSSGLDMFEISRVEIGDHSAARASESTAGIIFSATVLVVVLFLFNIVLNSGLEPLVVLMVPVVLASISSLVVRVSISGDSIRLGTGSFEDNMIWGGVLSEYGGVIPVGIVLPVLIGLQSGIDAVRIGLGLGASIVLLFYEFSRFSVQSRYSGWVAMSLLAIFTSLMPVIGVVLPVRVYDSYELWVWVVATAAALAIRAILMGRTAGRSRIT